MNILKTLAVLGCISTVAFCANVEESIRQNEVVIDALQKQLDAMQSTGDKKEAIEALQAHIDTIIEQQNKLLAQKIAPETAGNIAGNSAPSGNDVDMDEKIRRIVQEELVKTRGITKSSGNPYDTTHIPTSAELTATKSAEDHAPALPEQQSEAVGQYELALKLYNQGAYKEAAAGFGRIINTYPNDPISGKSLVHLAYCLEKQGNLRSASVVCEAALKKKLDDPHQVECQLIKLRFAKESDNKEEAAQILNSLKSLPLTAEQQKIVSSAQSGKHAATAPAKPAQAKVPAKAASATVAGPKE